MGKFLSLESLEHEHDGALGIKMVQQGGQKRLRGGADAGTGQHSTLLQTPRQELHGGSLRNSSKQLACRYDCQILRQAAQRSQPARCASRGQNYSCDVGAPSARVQARKALTRPVELTPPASVELRFDDFTRQEALEERAQKRRLLQETTGPCAAARGQCARARS